MKEKTPVLSKDDYESLRPEGEQKLEFPDYVVRAYVKDGELHVIAHRKERGHEMLPLGYMLGYSALTYRRTGK